MGSGRSNRVTPAVGGASVIEVHDGSHSHPHSHFARSGVDGDEAARLSFSTDFVRRLKRIFLFMGGEDGVIDFQEWMSSHTALGCKNKDLARAMFLIADRDNSGGITWNEFVGLMIAFATDSTDARMDALFHVLDFDKNGSVDQKELREGILRLLGAPGNASYTSLMDALLADAPPVVTAVEFRAVCNKLLKFAKFLTKVSAPFVSTHSGDEETTSVVSEGNWEAVDDDAPWTYTQVSQQTGLKVSELKHLHRRFNRLDADKSGLLEVSEFCKLLGDSPLAVPLFRAMDGDASGALGFVELARAVALQRGAPEQRCRLFFEMVDTDHSGQISEQELVTLVQLLEPKAGSEASEEHAFALAVHKACGSGSANDIIAAVTGYDSKAAAVEATTDFVLSPHGIDLDSTHRQSDFSPCQLATLMLLMLAIAFTITFVQIAPSQLMQQHLAAAVPDRDDLKLFMLHGMLIAAAALVVLLPLQFWNVKWSLVGNCVLSVIGSFLMYLGLLPDSPDMALLTTGRVLTVIGGEAGFVVLMIQVNLVYHDLTPFALAAGFMIGFATVSQFMLHISTWLVDTNGVANGLGLFNFIMGIVAVVCSLLFITIVNRAASVRRNAPVSAEKLNIASTLNSLLPSTGFRMKYVKQLPLRQTLVCVWIALAWAVFMSQPPYDTYSIMEYSDPDPDYDIIRMPARIFGVLLVIPSSYMVYRWGHGVHWLVGMFLLCGVTTLLSQADVTHYLVNVRASIGIALYPVMWTITTRGLSSRKIPSVAGPHVLSRFLAVVLAYAFSVWIWDAPDEYDTALSLLGVLCLVGAVSLLGFSMYDARTQGKLNAATAEDPAVLSGTRWL